jgi:glycosyltransferase involved in cell wall biosynthesis
VVALNLDHVRKRAVVVSPDPSSDAGGAERMCHQIAAILERLGFDVTLLGPTGTLPSWVERHGGRFLWQAGEVRRAVRRIRPEPELVVTIGPLGWPGKRGPPRIQVYATNLLRLARYQAGRWHWRARWGFVGALAEAMAARGATVAAISEQAAEDAERLYRAARVTVLQPGVNTELFKPRDRDVARRRLGLTPDARYGLFVGRGEQSKGADIALAACRRTGWDLLAAGARPVPGSRALGVLPAEELAWAYAAADAVVLPTAYEGWGYAVVEGVAAGIPVVTTPVGWARELDRLVPSYRPLLVPRDVKAVSRALEVAATGEAEAAVADARTLVLEHHTLAAFERRWRDLLVNIGLLPDRAR